MTLDESLGGRLLVVRGDPTDVVPRIAAAVDAPHRARRRPTSAPTGAPATRPSRRRWPTTAARSCAPGSPYAVAPGRVDEARRHAPSGCSPRSAAPGSATAGARPPTPTPAPSRGSTPPTSTAARAGSPIPDDDRDAADLPPAGEDAALARWREFLDDGVDGYKRTRDRPDRPGTSRMSVHLKYGAVHPRTLLADLAGRSGEGADTLRTELAWREFYADVLWHRPDSARENFDRRFDALPWDSGRRGRRPLRGVGRRAAPAIPIVDAGMRQLRATAWMHNRVRMIVASFLVKDLHLPWTRGARHFMQYLADGDLASNQHGWQWVAGTGTDAAPFFRVFNPITQGEQFDPARRLRAPVRPRVARRPRRGGAPAVGAARRPARRLPAAHRRPRRGAPGGPGPLRAGAGVHGLGRA